MPSAFHSSASSGICSTCGGKSSLCGRCLRLAGPETASIEEALKELQAGRPLNVVDDPERENEGDLVLPASQVTPELVAFFIRPYVGHSLHADSFRPAPRV